MNTKSTIKGIITSGLIAFTGQSLAIDIAVSPISDFSGWDTMPIGGMITLSASGAGDSETVVTDSTADAFTANVTINTANCPDYCMVRLDRWIGTINGKDVRAEVRISSWDGGVKAAEYRIRVWDSDLGTYTEQISRGFFGNSDGSEWNIDEKIGVGIGLEGDDVIFYSDTRGHIISVDLLGQVDLYDAPKPYGLFVYTNTDGDSISATFEDFLDVAVE
ncbi:hypothetical protein [Sedimenticola selenatireducens]|uniref:hypothetical protein n=1 Tax=Sedimenticola selenatireducens TaxID=191960 RepID=UPI00048D7BCF|nr:hypothetical protein [Sedimenticola selenatireducens]